MRSFLYTWGKDLAPKIKILEYQRAFRKRRFLPGTYIFSDVERLTPRESEWAAGIHNSLRSQWGDDILLLNHPTLSMRRFELLRVLHQNGTNTHNAFRLIGGDYPERYPVFIRSADDHAGATSPLIHSRRALEKEIERLTRFGKSREDKIIVEFCDTADQDGIYRKYSAFLINETIVPRHVCFSRNWQVKIPDVSNQKLIREETEFINSNNHADRLKNIFATARIQYGRIDYGIEDGTIRVWEINTNPRIASYISSENPARHKAQVLFLRLLQQAVERIDGQNKAAGGWVKNPLRKQIMRHRVRRAAKKIGESILFALPLTDRQKGIMRAFLVGMKKRWL